MPTNMSTGVSPAAQSLGLGGLLNDQVKDETDEERKRRIKQAQEQSLTGGTAADALLGGSGGLGY